MSTPLQITTAPLLLSCSPRKDGNCDTAAKLFASIRSDFAPSVRLCDYHVLPCTGCSSCLKANWQEEDRRIAVQLPVQFDSQQQSAFNCPCTLKDESAALLRRLCAATELCLVAPIYFYHLPAQLKALLDRLQPFWLRIQHAKYIYPNRRCQLILIGARERGEKLFVGSLLSLRYALAPLGFRIESPLLLYGLDGADALSKNESLKADIINYAK